MLGAENGPITPTPHLTNVRLGVQTVPHGVALDKGSQLTVWGPRLVGCLLSLGFNGLPMIGSSVYSSLYV